jgi:hypothetical protein
MRPSLDAILKESLKQFEMRYDDFEILRYTRSRRVVMVKQAVAVVAQEVGYRHQVIAGFLGQERSTIVNYLKQMRDLCDVYPDIRGKLDLIRKKVSYRNSHTSYGYLARSHSGLLTLSPVEPSRMVGYWVAEGSKPYKDQKAFPQITWESEPVKVKINVTIEEYAEK